jgi:prophage regulatory protein
MSTDDLGEEAFVRLPEVIRRTGLSRTTIYRRAAAGTFPAGVKIGANVVAWREADLRSWLRSPMHWSAAAD